MRANPFPSLMVQAVGVPAPDKVKVKTCNPTGNTTPFQSGIPFRIITLR